MREALTVIGFLLILAFAALFTAPLYVDWNSWRDDIALRLSQHFGTPVIIKGQIEARLLPQPWLSIGEVSIGDPYGATKLKVAGIDGDVSLGGLLRGDIDLSNVVIRSPELTLVADDQGLIEPLSERPMSLDAAVENFELRGGSFHYVNKLAQQDVTLTGINLVGESGSLAGPYKAEGGAQLGGVPHTLKLTTGVVENGGLRLRVTAVPADKPVTFDIDGEVKIQGGKPAFAGTATLMHPLFNTRAGDGVDSAFATASQTPWSISGPINLTPAGLVADKVAMQIGPEERALKLGGKLNMTFGPNATLDATLSGTQLELDRFAGIGPDKRQPPAAVLVRIVNSMPGLSGMPDTAHIDLSVDGMMLGGELMQNIRSSLRVSKGEWQVDHFETDLPGRSHLLLAGDLNGDDSGFKGNLSLRSDQATGLIGWLQGAPVLGRPDAAKKLSLQGDLVADADSVSLSKLALAIDDAKVNGQLAWKRLAEGRAAGRIEANLAAQRIDLDVLPSVAALLPGSSDIFSEADIKLAAEEMALSGIEAKSVSGHVKAGGKLIALEDVVINDLGGANLTANGRIDNIGAQPQGEIRIVLNGRDLTGLATALKRSTLPAFWVDAFAARAASLSPANASLGIAFGSSRQYSVDGKFGGSVIQFDTEFNGKGDQETADLRVKADSLDVASLLRQAGLSLPPGNIPGRASLDVALSGPLNGAMRWNGSFNGAGLNMSGTGKMTGPLEVPAFDGRLTASTDDALVPAQLFGVSLPGVMPAQSATLDSGFRMRAGRFVFDDVSGTVLGMPVSGALTVNPGKPLRIEGRLGFVRADAEVLGSLFAGADLGGTNANGNAFADEPFGTGTFDALAGKLAISADSLRLSRRLPDLSKAKATVSFGGRRVDVDNFSASLGGGSVNGALQLSHAALDTAATGHFVLQNVAMNTPDVSGTLGAGLDFQGTGRTPDALMSSLTGGGTIELKSPVLAELSDSAFADTIAAVDGGLAPDAAHIKPAFEQSLALKALNANTINGNLSLAGGVIRLASTRTTAGDAALALSGLLDLSDMTVKADLAFTPPDAKDGFGGSAPTIPVQVSGAIDALQREVDVSGLTAWLSIRGVEQQARKLEVLEAQRQAEDKILEDARRAEAEQMQKAIDEARRKAQPAIPPVIPAPKDQPGIGQVPAIPNLPQSPLSQSALPGASLTTMPSLQNLPGVLNLPGNTTIVPPTNLQLQQMPTFPRQLPEEQPQASPAP